MKKMPLFFVVIVLFVSCIAQGSQVAEWRLDGDLTDSVGTYNAARVNDPNYISGIVDQALDYSAGVTADPDNVIEVPYAAALNTADFTVSVWVNVPGGWYDYRAVVSNREQYDPAAGYIIYANPWGNWEIWFGTTAGWYIMYNGAIAYDEWTHVALSYDSTTGEAIFSNNGVANVYDLSGYTYVPTSSQGFRIGCGENEVAAGAFYWNGYIDHVQLWDNALTASEIAQNYADVIGEVVITEQPEPVTVVAGQPATLSVTALNATDYQWYKDGSPLSGETGDTLVISDVQLSDEGQYNCQVSNTVDTKTTNTVLLLTKRQMAEWRLDGDLTDSVGIYDATRVNDSSYTTGIVDTALDNTGVTVDPNNVIEVSYDPFLNSKDFTISTWVKLTGGAFTYRTVVSQRDQYTPAAGYIIYANNNDHWEVWLGVDGGWYIIDAGQIYFYDQWINVAVAYDSETKDVLVSVDGTLHYDNIGSYTYIPASSQGLRIGCGENETASGAFYMTGEIDHIQLWDYALDAYDVAQMYADISGQSVCVEAVEYDLTNDCVVNLEDFALIAMHWLDSNIVEPAP